MGCFFSVKMILANAKDICQGGVVLIVIGGFIFWFSVGLGVFAGGVSLFTWSALAGGLIGLAGFMFLLWAFAVWLDRRKKTEDSN